MDVDISGDGVSLRQSHEHKEFVYVDLVGFNNRNHFICKEFALVDGNYEYHAIIKPPYSFYKLPLHEREMAQWEIYNLHGLQYDSGDRHLLDVIENAYSHLISGKKIVVENNFKINCLKHMFRECGTLDCVNIDDMDFDINLQSQDSYKICDNHNQIFGESACECAVATAHRLKDITISNINFKNLLNMIESRKIEIIKTMKMFNQDVVDLRLFKDKH